MVLEKIELGSDYVISEFVKWMQTKLPEDMMLNFSRSDLSDGWEVVNKKRKGWFRELQFYIESAVYIGEQWHIYLISHTQYGFELACKFAKEYPDTNIKVIRSI